MTEKKINTQERKIQGYPPPLTWRHFNAYVKYTGMSESSAMSYILKNFFDNMPAQEKESMLKFGSNNHSKNSY